MYEYHRVVTYINTYLSHSTNILIKIEKYQSQTSGIFLYEYYRIVPCRNILVSPYLEYHILQILSIILRKSLVIRINNFVKHNLVSLTHLNKLNRIRLIIIFSTDFSPSLKHKLRKSTK